MIGIISIPYRLIYSLLLSLSQLSPLLRAAITSLCKQLRVLQLLDKLKENSKKPKALLMFMTYIFGAWGQEKTFWLHMSSQKMAHNVKCSQTWQKFADAEKFSTRHCKSNNKTGKITMSIFYAITTSTDKIFNDLYWIYYHLKYFIN